MISTETITIDGREFTHTYSDKDCMIRKIGTKEEYEEAYDTLHTKYKYEETEIKRTPREETPEMKIAVLESKLEAANQNISRLEAELGTRPKKEDNK